MVLTRLQLYEEYITKVSPSLSAIRIDAAISSSTQEAAILADMKTDLISALEQSKNIITLQKGISSTAFDIQTASIDQQIADIQGVI